MMARTCGVKRIVFGTGLGAGILAWPGVVLTQEVPEFLSAVPGTPALTFLGTSLSAVERPGNLRDLGVSIISGVGGSSGQGFGLDASLWTLSPSLSISLQDYQDSWLRYVLANTQISLGVVREDEEEADTEVALGIRATLVDRGDPMADPEFTEQLGNAVLSCAPDRPGQSRRVECVDSVTAANFAAISEQSKTGWRRLRVSVAVASGGRLPETSFTRMRYGGLDSWLVAGVPALRYGHLAAQAKYRYRPTRDSVPTYSEWSLGARLFVGSPTFNAFGEYILAWRSPKEESTGAEPAPRVDQRDGRWSVGFELRVASDLWISTGLGARYDALDRPDRSVVFANLKWGVASTNRINSLSPGS